MAEFSDYLENALINATLRATTYTSPTTVYLALFSADPTDAGTGPEIVGNGYARQAITFGAPSNGVSANTSTHTFTATGANWLSVTHVGIKDASTSGNLLYYSPVGTPRQINVGDSITVAAGAITVTLQ